MQLGCLLRDDETGKNTTEERERYNTKTTEQPTKLTNKQPPKRKENKRLTSEE